MAGPSASSDGAGLDRRPGRSDDRPRHAEPMPSPSRATSAISTPAPWVAFASPDTIVTGCRSGKAGSSPTFQIRRYALSGRDLGPVDGDPAPGRPRAGPHRCGERRRLHLGPARAHPVRPGPASRAAGGAPGRRATTGPHRPASTLVGDRPSDGTSPVWTDGRPATARAIERTLVGSADGRVLFAIGDGATPGSSSGVRVFDAQTLRLLERWPALASYRWLTVFEHGRFVALLGRPGLTATGGPAEWGAVGHGPRRDDRTAGRAGRGRGSGVADGLPVDALDRRRALRRSAFSRSRGRPSAPSRRRAGPRRDRRARSGPSR